MLGSLCRPWLSDTERKASRLWRRETPHTDPTSVLAPISSRAESTGAPPPAEDAERAFRGDAHASPAVLTRAHSIPARRLPAYNLFPLFSPTEEIPRARRSFGAASISPGPMRLATEGSGPALFPSRSGVFARAHTFPEEKFDFILHSHPERPRARALRSMHTFPKYHPWEGENRRGFFWDPSSQTVAAPRSSDTECSWGAPFGRERESGASGLPPSASPSDVFYSNLPSILSLDSSVSTNAGLRLLGMDPFEYERIAHVPAEHSAVSARVSEEKRCAESAQSGWEDAVWQQCGEALLGASTERLGAEAERQEVTDREAEAKRKLEWDKREEAQRNFAWDTETEAERNPVRDKEAETDWRAEFGRRDRRQEAGWVAEAERRTDTEFVTGRAPETFGVVAKGRAASVPSEGWRMKPSGTAETGSRRGPGLETQMLATGQPQQPLLGRLETGGGVRPLSLFSEQAESLHERRHSEPESFEDPTDAALFWNPQAVEDLALHLGSPSGQSQSDAAASESARARVPPAARPAVPECGIQRALEGAGVLSEAERAHGALAGAAGSEAEDAAAPPFESARESAKARPMVQGSRPRQFDFDQQGVGGQALAGTGREAGEGQRALEGRPRSPGAKRKVASGRGENRALFIDDCGSVRPCRPFALFAGDTVLSGVLSPLVLFISDVVQSEAETGEFTGTVWSAFSGSRFWQTHEADCFAINQSDRNFVVAEPTILVQRTTDVQKLTDAPPTSSSSFLLFL